MFLVTLPVPVLPQPVLCLGCGEVPVLVQALPPEELSPLSYLVVPELTEAHQLFLGSHLA